MAADPKIKTLLPDTNPKSIYGIKKPPMSAVPGVAIAEEAVVFALGAQKYGPYNWRENSVSARVYLDAADRHMRSWLDGEDNDEESGASHLAHARACFAIILDAMSLDMLIDDRPLPGATAARIKALTKR